MALTISQTIQAMAVFMRHADPNTDLRELVFVTYAEHDKVWFHCFPNPEDPKQKEDAQRLDDLGFRWDSSNEAWYKWV